MARVNDTARSASGAPRRNLGKSSAKMRRVGLCLPVAWLSAFTWSTPAAAWGASGHRTVCEIAFRNLTPTAKAEVARLLQARPALLASDPKNGQFGWACTYPDRTIEGGPVRRDPEHFVNYARSLTAVTVEAGCGEAYDCVDTAIFEDYARLKSRALPDRLRAVSLMYLGHWIGDIHQPLHNSFADDRGGGQVATSGLCGGGLHSTWDTCILQRNAFGAVSEPGIDAVQALAATWSGQVSDTDRAKWLSAAPWQWSRESYEIAITPGVQYCVLVQSTCQYDTGRVTYGGSNPRTVMINAQYASMAMPIIQLRITQAGIRLAHVINLALDPSYRGVE